MTLNKLADEIFSSGMAVMFNTLLDILRLYKLSFIR
jgi:hypothetical protein